MNPMTVRASEMVLSASQDDLTAIAETPVLDRRVDLVLRRENRTGSVGQMTSNKLVTFSPTVIPACPAVASWIGTVIWLAFQSVGWSRITGSRSSCRCAGRCSARLRT